MSDLRLALRQLPKSPGFCVVAILSLALGIGANTAIFSLVNDFLLRSLPVRNPSELVLLRTIEGRGGRMSRAGENQGATDPATGRFGSTSFSLLTFDRLRQQRSALSDVFAFAPFSQVNIIVDGQPEVTASAQFVSGNYYSGLGVPAVLGRTLGPEDDRASTAPVATISFRYWERRFGGDRDVLGKIIEINRVPTAIVGVTPQGFDGALQVGESVDVSVPLAQHLRFQPDRTARARASYWWIRIMGRLAPGATASQVRASLEPVFQGAAREGWLADRSANAVGEEMPGAPTLVAEPGGQGENDLRRQFAAPLRILMALVGLVLLAACANVANLLLARSAERRREIALRLALGASRGRIVRQLLTESSLLALAGAALGLALAWWTRGLLLALHPFGSPQVRLDLPIDARVLIFTVAAAVTTMILFGLAPALRATGIDVTTQLESTRTIGGRNRSRLNRVLMVTQIALSLVLLVVTGLFVRTLSNLEHVDAGFNRSSLILFRIDATSAGYRSDRYVELQSSLQERLQHLPGVESVTYSSVALLSSVRQNKRFSIPGRTLSAGVPTVVNTNGLAPNFFQAMQLPIVLGRGFSEHDRSTTPLVAVVNQAFVRTYFNGGDPVGQSIRLGSAPGREVEVVGVARDAKYTDLRGASPTTIYLPAFQWVDGDASFAVRVAVSDPSHPSNGQAAVVDAIRQTVRDVAPALPVLDMRTQDEQIDRLNAQPLLFARLSGLFGALTLALACVGLYGLMSHAVVRRRAEIGLRMALGAPPARVLRMIFAESLLLGCLGIVTGAGCSSAAARFVAAMLFDVSPADPLTYASAAAVLMVVATLASFLPARRASHVDPMVALKME